MPEFVVRNDYPDGTPGNVCYLCGSPQLPCIDTGQMVDGVIIQELPQPGGGWLVICFPCSVELGQLAGLVSSKRAETLMSDLDRLGHRVDEFKIRADAAETALDALRRYDLVKPVPEPEPESEIALVAVQAPLKATAFRGKK